MRVGVLMCAFREKSKIIASIKQFDNTPVSEILVTCSKKPWKGNLKKDNTANLALSASVVVKECEWEEEHEQKNWGMGMLSHMDWVIISSPDMFMTKESIFSLFDFLENTKHEFEAYGCACKTYWKDFNTIIKPDLPFNLIAIRPKVRFQYSSQPDTAVTSQLVPGVLLHHISWVKTNEEMKTKIKSYSHADEIQKGWYEKVWLRSHDKLTNFHPITPKTYQYLVKYPLPQEIINLFEKKWINKL